MKTLIHHWKPVFVIMYVSVTCTIKEKGDGGKPQVFDNCEIHSSPQANTREVNNVDRRPRVYLSCLFFNRCPKSQGAREQALDLISGAKCLHNLHYSSRTRPRISRGPSRARWDQNLPKLRAWVICISSTRAGPHAGPIWESVYI